MALAVTLQMLRVCKISYFWEKKSVCKFTLKVYVKSHHRL